MTVILRFTRDYLKKVYNEIINLGVITMREIYFGRIPEVANDAEIEPARDIANVDSFESLYEVIRRIPTWENNFRLGGEESAESVIRQIERIRDRANTRMRSPRDRHVIATATQLVPGTHGLNKKVRELLLAEGQAEEVSGLEISSNEIDTLHAAEVSTKLRLKETINGVDVIASWDPDGYYVIQFPGIDINSDAARNSHVKSNMIVIGEEEEQIRKTFEKAKDCLMTVSDPYLAYTLIEQFSKSL